MKRILGIVCILFSGYASAQVAHPENPNIVATIADDPTIVCIESDGSIDPSSCAGLAPNSDGIVYIDALDHVWYAANSPWQIGACGTAAVHPVTSAACILSGSSFAFSVCVNDGYVLVQSQSGYYFAVKADATCNAIATPDTTGIQPCLVTDAFDPLRGCFAIGANPSQMSVEGGYIKLDRWGTAPPASHCAEDAHEGRMAVDSVNSLLYVCIQSGWEAFLPIP